MRYLCRCDAAPATRSPMIHADSSPDPVAASNVAAGARTILIIDDEPQIRRAVRNALQSVAGRFLEAASGKEGIDLAAAERPDLIVLDLALPDQHGIEVCREIRCWSDTPIVVLSALHLEHEKVALLNAGADDYVTKPFALREFEARVRAQLRRASAAAQTSILDPIELEGIRIDFERRSVTRKGEPIRLTPIEWRILTALRAQAGRTLTHQHIFAAVWGRPDGNPQLDLRVHITNLRRKIEPDPAIPRLVVTEPGVGYRFEPQR